MAGTRNRRLISDREEFIRQSPATPPSIPLIFPLTSPPTYDEQPPNIAGIIPIWFTWKRRHTLFTGKSIRSDHERRQQIRQEVSEQGRKETLTPWYDGMNYLHWNGSNLTTVWITLQTPLLHRALTSTIVSNPKWVEFSFVQCHFF